MSELTGLELRKAVCEALGMELMAFRIFYTDRELPARDRFFDSIEDAQQYIDAIDEREQPAHRSNGRVEIRQCDRALPAIESDPAVSEPMFLEWCEKNECDWQLMTACFDEKPTISLLLHRHGTTFEVLGSTPSEARARAIVKAGAK